MKSYFTIYHSIPDLRGFLLGIVAVAGRYHSNLCCLLKLQCMTLVLMLSFRVSLLLRSLQDGASMLDQVSVITRVFLCSNRQKSILEVGNYLKVIGFLVHSRKTFLTLQQ